MTGYHSSQSILRVYFLSGWFYSCVEVQEKLSILFQSPLLNIELFRFVWLVEFSSRMCSFPAFVSQKKEITCRTNIAGLRNKKFSSFQIVGSAIVLDISYVRLIMIISWHVSNFSNITDGVISSKSAMNPLLQVLKAAFAVQMSSAHSSSLISSAQRVKLKILEVIWTNALVWSSIGSMMSFQSSFVTILTQRHFLVPARVLRMGRLHFLLL